MNAISPIVQEERPTGLSREQWREQSAVDGTDWISLADAVAGVLINLGILEREPTTFERLCERADRARSRKRR